jgi:hypothetical protein
MQNLKSFSDYDPSENINEGLTDFFRKAIEYIVNWFKRETKDQSLVKKVVKASPYDQGDHMLYIPHQQGAKGAAKIVLAAGGKYKFTKEEINKLIDNLPTLDPALKIVKDPKKSSKEKAIAFLEYQKRTWDKYRREALSNIQKHPKVKKGIEKIKNKHFPNEFLTTVAWKESSFNPKVTGTYRGLYQIGDLAWSDLKRIDPQKYKGPKAPLDTVINPQAGNDFIKMQNERFQKKLSEYTQKLKSGQKIS